MSNPSVAIKSDFSNSLSTLRQKISEETKGEYKNFLKILHPKYSVVWRDIFFGYVVLATILFFVQIPESFFWILFAISIGSLAVGYWVAFLQLFIHEAAHFNMFPNRALNDFLCDLLISWQVGTSIERYRQIHFRHHWALGEVTDSERSYFNALTPRFLLEMLTGIHPLRVFLHREKNLDQQSKSRGALWPLLRGVLMHLCLFSALIFIGAWPSSVAWVIGVGLFFPFFATLRQLLEHRSDAADPTVDYARQPHGAVTRMFGDDLFSATFGGAGFNRHLLHHWEPQISYSRLPELEKYLLGTSVASIIQGRRSSYFKVFLQILRNDSRSS